MLFRSQCLSTPFQCIPQRVGLAATAWAIFADLNLNPLSTAPEPTIECLFNWAERSYPAVLAPAGAATQYHAPFAYRYFSATDTYVGVSAVDRRVYYMGPDRLLQDLGALTVWAGMAACR